MSWLEILSRVPKYAKDLRRSKNRVAGNVSAACKTLWYSRDTFYRFKELYDKNGEEGLKEINRQKPNVKNRVAENGERACVDMAIEYPAYGKERAMNELKKQGIIISSGGVASVWKRHDLETFKKIKNFFQGLMQKENWYFYLNTLSLSLSLSDRLTRQWCWSIEVTLVAVQSTHFKSTLGTCQCKSGQRFNPFLFRDDDFALPNP